MKTVFEIESWLRRSGYKLLIDRFNDKFRVQVWFTTLKAEGISATLSDAIENAMIELRTAENKPPAPIQPATPVEPKLEYDPFDTHFFQKLTSALAPSQPVAPVPSPIARRPPCPCGPTWVDNLGNKSYCRRCHYMWMHE